MDVDVVDDFNNRSTAFLTWLREHGVSLCPKIALSDQRHRNAGRAVVATQSIGEDEELFSIPRSSILTPETSALPAEARLEDPWLSLITAMIYEHSLGESSRWSPYLAVLPTEFDSLMFWSETELKELAGSAVVDKIGKASADKTLTETVVPIVKAHIYPDLTDMEILALAHRFGSTIMSFAFDLENPASAQPRDPDEEWEEDEEDSEVLPKGMVPLADMLNADAERNNAKLFYENDAVIMRATQSIEAGEEIFNDYGPLPRGDLLRRYGYITDNYAKYDVVEVAASLITAAAQDLHHLSDETVRERTQYLEDQGTMDDGFDIARPENESGQFGDELKVLLNTLVLPSADFAKLRAKDKLPGLDLSKPAAELLYAVLVRRLAAYPSTPDGRNLEHSRRVHMARQVIEGEKECLKLAAEAVRDMLGDGGKNMKRKAVTFEEEAESFRSASKSHQLPAHRIALKNFHGEEIFNDYGPLPRGDLLRRYGYITDNYAKYDVVEVAASLITAAAQDLHHLSDETVRERTQYLEDQGTMDDGFDIARPENESGQFGDELKVLLNTLVLPSADFAKLRAKDKLPGLDLSKPAAELLYAVLVRRLAAYPSTPDGRNLEHSRRVHMARQVIEGEKECLKLAAEAVRDMLGDGGKNMKRKAVTFEEEAESFRSASKR
nr:ribosomal lysine n-methyltransferase 4 [Quercus suber]